jgi:hypothetical protein
MFLNTPQRYKNLIDALVDYFQYQNKDIKEEFVWFDVLSVNQHDTGEEVRDQEWWGFDTLANLSQSIPNSNSNSFKFDLPPLVPYMNEGGPTHFGTKFNRLDIPCWFSTLGINRSVFMYAYPHAYQSMHTHTHIASCICTHHPPPSEGVLFTLLVFM